MAETLMQMYNEMTAIEQKELFDFALFLISRSIQAQQQTKKRGGFGALKDKISYISDDFDEPLEDFEEYM